MDNRLIIAIYFDIENINPKLDISTLLDSISLNIAEEMQAVFAIKLACGNEESIKKFINKLRDLNFDIRVAPHVSRKNFKNRSDLILSLEAFETLVHEKPEIDLYVFITSDTDFTVIMDKLRKFGKRVWLVTNESTSNNKLFSNSSDTILKIEDNLEKGTTNEKTDNKTNYKNLDTFSKVYIDGIVKIIDSFEKDKWHPYSAFGVKMKNLYKDFSYKGHKINSQTKLFNELKKQNMIEIKKIDKIDHFRVL